MCKIVHREKKKKKKKQQKKSRGKRDELQQLRKAVKGGTKRKTWVPPLAFVLSLEIHNNTTYHLLKLLFTTISFCVTRTTPLDSNLKQFTVNTKLNRGKASLATAR